MLAHSEHILEHVRVPMSMVSHPQHFGGQIDADCLLGDLVIHDSRVTGMRVSANANHPPRMVIPKLAECHVHLDKCHTVSRMDAIGGDLHAAIEAQREDKRHWTYEDIRERAQRGLEELINSGCGVVRSHVDWNGGAEVLQPPEAWQVLTGLASDFADKLELQVSPLIGIDDLARPGIAEELARLIAPESSVMGAFVFDQPERQVGIRAAFAAAEKYGLALDFHVDEGLNADLKSIGMIADAAIEAGFSGPILCGHACSLMNLQGDELKGVMEKIQRAGIHVVSLPATNLYLQGRGAGTPDRRGITRLLELEAAGVPVAIGTDNVCDAFCPIGRHDPRQSLLLGILAAHLDPPFASLLPMISSNARLAMGRQPEFVDNAGTDELLVFSAGSTSELIADINPPRSLMTELKVATE